MQGKALASSGTVPPLRPADAPEAEEGISARDRERPDMEEGISARDRERPDVEEGISVRDRERPDVEEGISARDRALPGVEAVRSGLFFQCLWWGFGFGTARSAIQAAWIGPGGQKPLSTLATLTTSKPSCLGLALDADKPAEGMTIQSFWNAKMALVCPIHFAWMTFPAQKRRSSQPGSL